MIACDKTAARAARLMEVASMRGRPTSSRDETSALETRELGLVQFRSTPSGATRTGTESGVEWEVAAGR